MKVANHDKHINLVDVDLQEAAQFMTGKALSNDNLQAYRDEVLSHAQTNIDPSLDISIAHQTVNHEGHQVEIEIIQPNSPKEAMPAYLYMHGGGMVSGDCTLDNEDNARLADELQCMVVSVDYRLAPETKFPGQLEDCYAVLKWMHDNANTLNIDASRIAIGGNSAGGALTASLAQMAVDRGEVNIVLQNLHIPMLDDRTVNTKTVNEFSGDYGWTREMNDFAWEMYLGHKAGQQEPETYAVPARRDNLSGLPATLITIGSLDLFVDEAMDYAHRLIRSGVKTEFHVYPGLYHLGEHVPGARIKDQLFNDRLSAMKRAFYG